MRKNMAVSALIALKPLEIQKIYFMKKSLKYDRKPIQVLKSQVWYCVSCQTLVFVKNWQFSICGVSKVGKKCSNCKNKVTFTNKIFYGPGMKVTLFLRFGEILMLKMVSKDSQL